MLILHLKFLKGFLSCDVGLVLQVFPLDHHFLLSLEIDFAINLLIGLLLVLPDLEVSINLDKEVLHLVEFFLNFFITYQIFGGSLIVQVGNAFRDLDYNE